MSVTEKELREEQVVLMRKGLELLENIEEYKGNRDKCSLDSDQEQMQRYDRLIQMTIGEFEKNKGKQAENIQKQIDLFPEQQINSVDTTARELDQACVLTPMPASSASNATTQDLSSSDAKPSQNLSDIESQLLAKLEEKKQRVKGKIKENNAAQIKLLDVMIELSSAIKKDEMRSKELQGEPENELNKELIELLAVKIQGDKKDLEGMKQKFAKLDLSGGRLNEESQALKGEISKLREKKHGQEENNESRRGLSA